MAPGSAARRLAALRCRREKLQAVVSMGYCGALDPAVPGMRDICGLADRDAGGSTWTARARFAQAVQSPGTLISVDRVVRTVEEKRRLRAPGPPRSKWRPPAVALGRRTDCPSYCVRVVMDRRRKALDLDFNRFRDADGRFSRAADYEAALARPRAPSRNLIRLTGAAGMAARALGDFLADCDF